MSLQIRIVPCENGFIIYEDDSNQRGLFGKSWVANTTEELGKLVQRLYDEQAKKKQVAP